MAQHLRSITVLCRRTRLDSHHLHWAAGSMISDILFRFSQELHSYAISATPPCTHTHTRTHTHTHTHIHTHTHTERERDRDRDRETEREYVRIPRDMCRGMTTLCSLVLSLIVYMDSRTELRISNIILETLHDKHIYPLGHLSSLMCIDKSNHSHRSATVLSHIFYWLILFMYWNI
jgi:hypothetical protein